ncbi:MAG: SU10 major capsid protein [Bacteroidota bacterium]
MPFDIIGAHSHYDDPESIMDPQMLDFASEIKMSIYEAQIWNRIQGLGQPPQTEKFKIAARTRTGLAGVIGDGVGAGWDNSATTSLPMTADAVNILTVGSVLELYDGTTKEVVVVTSINRSNNTIEVQARGEGSTDAQTWADESTFRVIGNAIRDDDAQNVEARHEKTYKYENLYQLIYERISLNRSDLNKREYFQNQLDIEYREALDRVFRLLARSIVNGVKVEGSNSVKAMSAGILDQLIDTAGGERAPLRSNINGTLTETKLKTALEEVLKRGKPNAIYMNPVRKSIFNNFTNSENLYLGISGDELLRTRGLGNFATHYNYEGVSLELVADEAMPADRIAICNEQDIAKFFKPDDPLRLEAEERESVRKLHYALHGKVGFAVKNVGTDHADLYGITG